MGFNLLSRRNPRGYKLLTGLTAFILAGIMTWFASPAIAEIWNDGFETYSDSNPLTIPGGDSGIEEWDRHE